MKKAVIYMKQRVDEPDYITNGRLERCKAFAKQENLEILDICWDQISNDTRRLYAFKGLLNDSKEQKFDVIIINTISNVTRSRTKFIEYYKQLRSNNVKLMSVDGLYIYLEDDYDLGLLQ